MKNKIEWRIQAQITALAHRRDGRALNVSVLQAELETWIAIAVETSGAAVKSDNVDVILDSHGHHNLGEFDSMSAAVIAAEAFTKAWMTSGVNIEECACEAIG